VFFEVNATVDTFDVHEDIVPKNLLKIVIEATCVARRIFPSIADENAGHNDLANRATHGHGLQAGPGTLAVALPGCPWSAVLT
jgi:hypothetical protein